ncbi:beta-galactosidase [Stackebrandtia nassauensis]|uniref:Beta-galactosidase n=1 Tax=Stackebrandtia nassauensis (strain DSM 44728 / CIP 108903 / NRRL B-16338 / NBRC 102104 / LLR-40K-21) TaxID=446470 RepID=D3Q7E1_STANL|nr:beta-galactosidase [Stackebrandtia nassauensis]ADD42412.1 Beta-galactosidase [Stackebrandtia nassauensis DSM 44728]
MSLTRVPGLLYGGDYNPEQWPPHVWREDARLMAEAGVNLVTLGVFSWARLEPAPGEYDLDWLAEIIDLLWEHGVAVDLATGTASPPPWFVRDHPRSLPVTADGTRLEFGSRQHYCPSSPEFRAAATALTTKMAQRFADHPALALWHVSNEYGDELQECFCEVSAADFRRWLRDRYRDLDAFNHAWGTDFWSQRYTSFDQVEPPRAAPGPINPTQQLDWRRFCSDAMLACYRSEKEVLDRLSPGVPVTTNFMSMLKALDYWEWARHEDLVSDDAYPDPADPKAHIGAALNYDLMRSLRGGQPWLLLEQAPSAVSWREVNVPKTPQQYRLWSIQTVARGADGVMHFQWRASQAGAEKFHSAMLPHGGTTARGWERTVRMGAELRSLAPVAGHRTTAQVAMLLDWDSWWALEIDQHPSALVLLKEQIRAWYEPLWEANITVDFVPVTADLSAYRAVLAPNLYLTDAATASKLRAFTDGGGTLVVGFFSGIVDRDDHIVPGGHPGALRDLLGLTVDEFWPLPAGERVALDQPGAYGTVWRDWIVPSGADVEIRYADGELAGRPAVTRHGNTWYLSTLPDPATLSGILRRALTAASVTPVGQATPGVELCRRGPYLFALNHTDATATVTSVGDRVDLLSGKKYSDHVDLGPLEVVCLSPEDS